MAAKKQKQEDDSSFQVSPLEPPKAAVVKPRTDTSDVLSLTPTVVAEPCYDIEHVPVDNDPRAWSELRKVIIVWVCPRYS